MKEKQETFSLVFTLPEGEVLFENPELINWIAVTVGVCNHLKIKCEFYLNGKKEEIKLHTIPAPRGDRPN